MEYPLLYYIIMPKRASLVEIQLVGVKRSEGNRGWLTRRHHVIYNLVLIRRTCVSESRHRESEKGRVSMLRWYPCGDWRLQFIPRHIQYSSSATKLLSSSQTVRLCQLSWLTEHTCCDLLRRRLTIAGCGLEPLTINWFIAPHRPLGYILNRNFCIWSRSYLL
jgi:hypothetical protein